MNLIRRSRTRPALPGALLIALLTALLTLVGCSDGDETPTMAPTQSVASTPSDEPSGEETPAPLDPVDTVRAWVEARNRAMSGGDTRAVEALTMPGCKSCYGLIDPIKEIYAAGGFFDTTGWQVVRARQRPGGSQVVRVDTAVLIAGGRTQSASGEEPVSYQADKRLVVFKLRQADAAWLVSFVGFLS